ncbi:enhancer of mRNA-decapping protein 3-like [Anneissia japonica]|uniref:enhancer of mRNA-decapping protein 3-like n=1 Tax=Anneissia japonica TaxID=1529436 RepID=UPI0014257E01|nr:enhancer of mRNA-decapping protein 3-like [Anneissia japonica]
MSANIAEFIGSYLSLDCGDPLGTYQGEVENVNKCEQTISLKTPFHNGVKTCIPLVTISAKDIKDLQILKTQEQVSKENDSKVSKLPTKGKPANIVLNNRDEANLLIDRGQRTPRKNQTFFSHSPNGKKEENGYRNQYNSQEQDGQIPPRRSSNLDGLGIYQSSHRITDNSPDRLITRRNSSQQKYSAVIDDSGVQIKNGKLNDEDDKRRKRHNSGSFEAKVKASPKKIEGRSKSLRARKDLECFSAPTESFLTDFDFESNLALFDKAAIFEAIDAKSGTIETVNSPKQEPKFRHDEMIVDTGKPTAKRQILVNRSVNLKEYTTDEGFVVPSISQDLHEKLLINAEKSGITVERRIEAVGRTAAVMALQVLGGVNRINFENSHQLPSVVVLCGPHVQGAQGACCARHLANHNLPVTVLAPNLVKMHDLLDQEIKLFQETDGVVVTNYKDLPVEPVDLLICALDSHHTHLRSQGWYQTTVQWATQCKAPLLTLDPPSNQTISSKWALAVGLPFTYGDAVGKLYLGDIGITSKVFTNTGVKYSSPFGHKFVIPLHNT